MLSALLCGRREPVQTDTTNTGGCKDELLEEGVMLRQLAWMYFTPFHWMLNIFICKKSQKTGEHGHLSNITLISSLHYLTFHNYLNSVFLNTMLLENVFNYVSTMPAKMSEVRSHVCLMFSSNWSVVQAHRSQKPADAENVLQKAESLCVHRSR